MELFGGHDTFKSWVEASSLLAAGLYAFGWIFTARLFSRFGVTPEEAGFSFAFLLIRVGFLVVAFVGALMLLVWTLNKLAAREGTKDTTVTVDGIVKVVVIPIAILSSGYNFWFLIWGRSDGGNGESSSPSTADKIVNGLIGIAGAVAVSVAYSAIRNRSFSLQSVLRVLSYGFVVVGFVALVATPFIAADWYADEVEKGNEPQVFILPGVAGLTIPRLQATTSDTEPISPQLGRSACVHLLGSSGGTVVLYDYESDSVIRVPQGRVSLEDPCK